MVALLLLPVWTVPGLWYWDIIFWLDTAHRIDFGQIPNVDFFTHLGPLSGYGLWLMQKLFPSAHPVLAAQLFFSIIGLPLLALILVDLRSRLQSFLLGGIFIALLLLPANFFMQVFNFGIDLGIHNRQAGLLLYLLIAGLLFVKSSTRLFVVVTSALLCLLFTKITVFVGASVLVLYAFLLGRITPKVLISIVVAIIAAVFLLQLTTGIFIAYLGDIGRLMDLAGSSASSEIKQDPIHRLAFTIYSRYDLLIPLGLLVVAALIEDRHALGNSWSLAREDPLRALRNVLRVDGVALAVLAVVALVIESQNSGGQEFAFLVPAVLWIMFRPVRRDFPARAAMFLAAAFLLIVAIKITHHALLITSHALNIPRLEAELEPFHLRARPADVAFAEAKLAFYSANKEAYAEFASRQQELAPGLDEGFQLAYFVSVGSAVRAIRRWQAERKVLLESIATLDFVDPFPTLLEMKPVVGLGVVMDPYRTAGQWNTILHALSMTDGILVPSCPISDYRYQYAERAARELENRRAISIDPCWSLYVKRGL